ncbi:hypothetical protein ILUMI_24050 [Ignelater luminosus]|uniref:LEM domain-containing protein n=1 Tax=Ignelater luminosus TaxID=2038154 RepID=A0A8K0C7Q6_IGNLU|nr:hypothetical protein ILUMI_24050 [Ignelater luminosus]
MNVYRGRSFKEFSLASALYDAIKDNDYRGVIVLLEKGADPNFVLSCGISPFHLVIGDDSKEFALKTTKLILQYGGNPNIQTDEGLTPLHIAAAWGNIDIVKLLLNCGVDPEITDSNGLVPIYYAIEYKHPDIIVLLRNAMYEDLAKPNAPENENYDLVLDKIVVNNGHAEAEYELESEKENSLELQNLQKLPQTTPSEYVRDWCQTHAVEIQAQNELVKVQEPKEKSFDSCNFSHESKKSSPQNLPFVNCNRRRVNKNVIENFSLSYEPSIKYKTRRSASARNQAVDVSNMTLSISKQSEVSRESGIITLHDTSFSDGSSIVHDINNLNINELTWNEMNKVNEMKSLSKQLKDASSDYFTSNELSGSTNIMDQNVFDLTSRSTLIQNNVTKCTSHGLSFNHNVTKAKDTSDVPRITSEDGGGGGGGGEEVKCASLLSVAEVYKYTDNKEGIVLYEKRLLVNSKNDGMESNISAIQSHSSKLSSLPATFDYDTDTLRNELTQCGYHPGPITKTTKRVYLKKLRHLKRQILPRVATPTIDLNNNKVYSVELQETLSNPNWVNDLSEYKNFEEIICKDFTNPDRSRKWREGINKSSFTYLLLDPRVTKNLPCRAEEMSSEEIWKAFLSSIFYVGKGKRNRPYLHLYEAVSLWRQKDNRNLNKKLQQILNIWNDGYGVICLHVFQNVIPVEAYTREAAMINALKVDNIKNIKVGDFYGTASTWSSKQQNMLGAFLLYKAMQIFLNEGERQLRPADIS